MWEAIKKVRGISENQNDQTINDMIRRTLEDEVIPFDEWQSLLEDIDAEWKNAPDADAILQEHGLTMDELVKQAETARKDFLEALRRYNLPLEDRFELCQRLYEAVKETPSDELLRLYCDIVCDDGCLLGTDRSEEDFVCRLHRKADADALYGYLSERAEMSAYVRKILEKAKEIKFSNLNYGTEATPRAGEVFQVYIQIFKPAKCGEMLLDNISHLLQIADCTEELAPIKPLFLYRMLTRHGKRLQTSEELKVDFRTLWNYQEYNFEKDNGKNYRTNVCYLELFSRLCDIFQSDKAVDIPLCVCGFDQLSNLSEFYRLYEPTDFEIPFEPPIEDLLDESLFTCFEHGCDDNVVMTDSGITLKELDQFQSSADRRRFRALAQISDYMNGHISDLVERFWRASPETVKTLCGEILEASELPPSQQPKTAQETAFFLAAINRGLMEAVDGMAEVYLTAAGQMFVNQ